MLKAPVLVRSPKLNTQKYTTADNEHKETNSETYWPEAVWHGLCSRASVAALGK